MIDPFDTVLGLIAGKPAIAAVVGASVSSNAEPPPSVQLVDNATSRRPFGRGSGQLGLQLWVGFAKCYGTDDPAGAVAARSLAGLVSDLLHNHAPYAGAVHLQRIYAPDIQGIERDPDLHWPFYTVRLEVYASAQAAP